MFWLVFWFWLRMVPFLDNQTVVKLLFLVNTYDSRFTWCHLRLVILIGWSILFLSLFKGSFEYRRIILRISVIYLKFDGGVWRLVIFQFLNLFVKTFVKLLLVYGQKLIAGQCWESGMHRLCDIWYGEVVLIVAHRVWIRTALIVKILLRLLLKLLLWSDQSRC